VWHKTFNLTVSRTSVTSTVCRSFHYLSSRSRLLRGRSQTVSGLRLTFSRTDVEIILLSVVASLGRLTISFKSAAYPRFPLNPQTAGTLIILNYTSFSRISSSMDYCKIKLPNSITETEYCSELY
jgi:hypothetical protein